MTKLDINQSVTRESRAVYRGRPLIVTASAHEIRVREKGRRLSVGIPILAVYDLGFKILARERAREKKEKRIAR